MASGTQGRRLAAHLTSFCDVRRPIRRRTSPKPPFGQRRAEPQLRWPNLETTVIDAPAAGPTVRVGARRFPVVLPSPRDPRLHLAVVIVSLQVLGQTSFDFDLSIAQILVSVLTCV